MRIPRRQLQPFTNRWTAGHPPLWIVLIAANTGFFLAQKLIDYSDPHWLEGGLGLSREGIAHGCFWQFFTYTFLHGNLMHLLSNMLLLYFAGREVEALVGPRHFLAIYFGGGLLGGIAQLMVTPQELIGASAGVLAVLIAFTTILPELELSCLLFFVIPVRIRAKNLALLIVGATVIFIFVPYLKDLGNQAVEFLNHDPLSTGHGSVTIAHYAHLAGCIFGWLYVKQLGYGNPWRIQRYLFEKKQQEERRKHMTAEQFITQEIDPILEKISRDGMRSLTRSERRILHMGREKIEKTPL